MRAQRFWFFGHDVALPEESVQSGYHSPQNVRSCDNLIEKTCLAKPQRRKEKPFLFSLRLCAFARDDLFFHTDKHLVTGFLENAERIFETAASAQGGDLAIVIGQDGNIRMLMARIGRSIRSGRSMAQWPRIGSAAAVLRCEWKASPARILRIAVGASLFSGPPAAGGPLAQPVRRSPLLVGISLIPPAASD